MIRFLYVLMLLAVYIFHGSSSLMCFTFYISLFRRSSLVVLHSSLHSSLFIRHLFFCLLHLVTRSSSLVVRHLVICLSHFVTHHFVTRRSSLVVRHLVTCLLHFVTRHSSFFIHLVTRHSSLVTSSFHSSLVTRQWRATPPQKAIKGRERSQLGIYLVLWTPPRPARWAIH